MVNRTLELELGLLHHLYPAVAYPLADRIAAAMTAYACADALGLPWENFPPAGASAGEIEALPARAGWKRGATSDDTALTLLVAQHLAERSGAGDARVFLETLVAEADSIKGLGPSTIGAIEHFRAAGELPTSGGTTNGAPMRALPVGWATPLDDSDRRRRLAIELTRATHPDPEALSAACVIAACASWALEGASSQLLLDVARKRKSRRELCAEPATGWVSCSRRCFPERGGHPRKASVSIRPRP